MSWPVLLLVFLSKVPRQDRDKQPSAMRRFTALQAEGNFITREYLGQIKSQQKKCGWATLPATFHFVLLPGATRRNFSNSPTLRCQHPLVGARGHPQQKYADPLGFRRLHSLALVMRKTQDFSWSKPLASLHLHHVSADCLSSHLRSRDRVLKKGRFWQGSSACVLPFSGGTCVL